jgi:hypothetical protein
MHAMTADTGSIGRSILAVGISYVRWTQLVPMLVAWAFLLLALGLMALANFQQQGFSVIGALVALWERYAWLPRLDGAVTQQPDGSLILDSDGFRATVVSAWGALSLVLLLISLVRRALFGPAAPLRFRRAMVWLLLPAAAVWAAFVGIYLFSGETFHGPAWQWLLMFTAGCAAVLLVSAYSLGVSAVLDCVEAALAPRADAAADAVVA